MSLKVIRKIFKTVGILALWSVVLLFTTISMADASEASKRTSPFSGKPGTPALIFSISQGFRNGPVENGDMTVLKRMVDSINKFRVRYPVFALLNVRNPKDKKIIETLQLLKRNKLPFILDVYSSDVLTIPNEFPAYDVAHGVPLSFNQIQYLKNSYGTYFSGFRIFEVFSENFTVSGCKRGHQWCLYFSDRMPKGDFFDPHIVDQLIAFAYKENMFVLFSDWYWSFDHRGYPSWQHQKKNEMELGFILNKYPKTVIVMYDNNEPQGQSLKQFGKWESKLSRFLSDGAVGIGLSDQSWICSEDGQNDLNCPVTRLINWAKNAIASGAVAIETEPYWYWWKVTRGENQNNYVAGSGGEARATLRAFAKALGVGGI